MFLLQYSPAIRSFGKNRKETSGSMIKKDYCLYCKYEVPKKNFARHFLNNHPKEAEVQKIMALPNQSLDRRRLIALLRKKGQLLNKIIE